MANVRTRHRCLQYEGEGEGYTSTDTKGPMHGESLSTKAVVQGSFERHDSVLGGRDGGSQNTGGLTFSPYRENNWTVSPSKQPDPDA